MDTNGQPVANAQVALAVQPSNSFGPPLSKLMLNGEPFFNPAGVGLFKTTDEEGRFKLNLNPAATGVIAVHQGGFARTEINGHTNLVVRLQPWGGIEGTAWEYDHLVTNQSIWAGAVIDPNDQALQVELRTNADDRGRFAWTRCLQASTGCIG